MNTLSWLIYFGDLSDSLSSVLAGGAFLGIFLALGLVMYGGIIKDDNLSGSATWNFGNGIQKKGLLCLILVGLFATMSALLPSKKTVYLIAASEAGEKVVTSEVGKKALDAVNRYLDDISNNNEEQK